MQNENPPEAENNEEHETPPVAVRAHQRHWRRFKSWFGSNKKISVPLVIILLLAIVCAVPWTRYAIAGSLIKKDFTVQVTDSTAHIPVSGATVSIGPVSAMTNGEGSATLRDVKVGAATISIAKKYYQTKTAKQTVPVLKQKNIPSVLLVATGRQAKIHVTNIITNKVLPDVDIQIAGTSAKTDSSGNALVVLPANGSLQKSTLRLSGFNDAIFEVQASGSSLKENDFSLTPAGKVYFVSNRRGFIDLLKSNLDGSGTETVVDGTGSESQYDTQIMESADGKYVALVTKRNATDPTPQLYVLATADDRLFQADTGNALFHLYDWAGDTLIYTVQRQDLPVWQQGASKLKAYDAGTGGITLLDQSAGADAGSGGNENYTEVMVTADSVVYAKSWQGQGAFPGKQDSLQSIGFDGKNHQSIATYDLVNYLNFTQHGPNTLYIWQQNTQTNEDTYTQYQEGGQVKSLNITNEQFYDGQGVFYFSAARKQAFWAEPRDGKNALLVGDPDGGNSLTIATASDYQPYGWFGDQYLLLSKDSSLYVMGVKGGTPVKVADYLSTNYSY